MRQIDAVDQHPAALRHVQALDQLGQRALAGAGAADDADDFAGLDVETDAAQHFGAVGPVAEDAPGRTRSARPSAAGLLVSGCRPIASSVRALRMSPRRCTEMPVCWKSVHSCARRMIGCATRPASMLKAISWPTRELAFDHQPRAQPQGDDGDQLADQGDAFVRQGAEGGGAKAGRHVGGELVVPAARSSAARPPWP